MVEGRKQKGWRYAARTQRFKGGSVGLQAGHVNLHRVEKLSERRALLADRPDSSIFQKRCGKHSGGVPETTVPKHVRQ
jgi:hypothetical protein